MSIGITFRSILGILAAVTFLPGLAVGSAEDPLVVAVMDPLAKPLACACVKGYAQRNYDRLGAWLQERLGRPVQVVYAEALSKALRLSEGGRADLVIGKCSVVRHDAKALGLEVRPIALLTGKDGSTIQTGLFLVPTGDGARSVGDLKGYRIIFGPADSDEKHAAALAALRAAELPAPETIETRPGCSDAALEALESTARPGTAAVISGYALAILEGCGTIQKGSLRVVGRTGPVPFVGVFAGRSLGEAECGKVLSALKDMAGRADLLVALETKQGFLPWDGADGTAAAPAMPTESPPPAPAPVPAGAAADSPAIWPGWRGPRRDGIAPWLPERLTAVPRILWRKDLESLCLAGVAATDRWVVVGDRDGMDQKDVFRCLRSDTGAQAWEIRYGAAGKLDYGNAPRATPLIHGDRVFLLGAFGHLHCVSLADGAVLWRKNIILEFQAKVPTWGVSGSPLVVDGRLILQPGGPQASMVALDAGTGEVQWRSPGLPSAYASVILGTFGGVRQVVGYDKVSLGGWDPVTGERLWKVLPPVDRDYNVPTPVDLGGRLLVCTENNGARIFGFGEKGMIEGQPAAATKALVPDSSTPVILNGLAIGSAAQGEIVCLDTRAGLAKLWTLADNAFESYTSFIGSGDRVLATIARGEILLVRVGRDRGGIISRMRPFGPESDADLHAHPALVGRRLIIRGGRAILCMDLDDAQVR